MTKPFDQMVVRFKNGREALVEVTDVSEGYGFYTQKVRANDWKEDPLVYFLALDGTVRRERWGTGRNAGECNAITDIDGATWREA